MKHATTLSIALVLLLGCQQSPPSPPAPAAAPAPVPQAAPPVATPPPPVAPGPAASGSETVLKVAERAATFLAAAQNENGSWGLIPDVPVDGVVGITGLAIKALATLPTSLREAHRERIARGVAYLKGKQAQDGSILNPPLGNAVYTTAVAVMALDLADPEGSREAIVKATAYLKAAQFGPDNQVADEQSGHYGGWGYDKSGKGPDADLSNTQFAIAALHEAGLPPDDPVYQRALRFISRCQNRSESNDRAQFTVGDDGGFIYDTGERLEQIVRVLPGRDGQKAYASYASMTYAGLKSMLHASLGRDDPRVQAAWAWIQQHYTLEENHGLGARPGDPAGQQGLYYYYYTFAKALAAYGEREIVTGDGVHHDWARELAEQLAKLQGPDGSWVNANPRWWEADPVLVTSYALCALNTALEQMP